MTALRPKADAQASGAECPLVTHSGHWTGQSANGRNRPETAIRDQRCERPLSDRKSVIGGHAAEWPLLTQKLGSDPAVVAYAPLLC
jgi:hypothetical protein